MNTAKGQFWRALVAERLVLTIIVLNAIVLFLRGFSGWSQVPSEILWHVDYLCTIYFAVELLTKTRLLGWRGYWSSGWNRFDFVVVVASAPHLLSPFLELDEFAVVLVLRTARLMRVMRLMHFIPDVEHLWLGIARALRASIGVLIALIIYNFVLGLVACYLFRETGSPFFQDPVSSMYAIFRVFTVEGWHDIPDSVAAHSGTGLAVFIRLFFVFAVLTGGLLGLSLANAVFVDEMIKDNNDDLERQLERLRSELAQDHRRSMAEAARVQRSLALLAAHLGVDLGPEEAAPKPPTPPDGS